MCKGIGMVLIEPHLCSFCQGNGNIVVHEETVFCHNCKGSGKVPLYPYVECSDCFGTGEATPQQSEQ